MLDHPDAELDNEFLLKVQSISRLEHNNVVQLLSYCIEESVHALVYEYSSRGSLHDILHGKKGAVGGGPGKALSWAQRVNIASSSAEGIEFIYEKAEHCITHRVIKSSNILLFDNDVAKVIGDIGAFESNPGHKINPDPLYYAFPPHWSNLDGYGAPEYLMTGEFSNKSEVFSFGVVLLELLTGRKARDCTQPHDQQDLVSWATPRLRTPRRMHHFADPRLGGEYPHKDFAKVILLVMYSTLFKHAILGRCNGFTSPLALHFSFAENDRFSFFVHFFYRYFQLTYCRSVLHSR